MDNELLKSIDDVLNATLPVDIKTQFAGRVQQIYDPQARRPALMHYVDGKAERFTLNTVHYDVQVAHRLMGGQPVKNPSHFGSRQKVSFDLEWTLICATKRPEIMTSFLLAFSALSDMDVREFSTDTLNVLRTDFLFVPDQKSPYDPLLQCFSIRYTMQNISDSIFSQLCNPIF